MLKMSVDKWYAGVKYMALEFHRAHREYEVDELINEIWLSPPFQTMTSPGMIWQACRWALLKYHRQQSNNSWRCVPLFDEELDPRNHTAQVEAIDWACNRLRRLTQKQNDLILAKIAGESHAETLARTGEQITSQGLTMRWRRAKAKMQEIKQ